ncbi:hypothetical protein SLEP1_g13079 [Rubroshorea leprosula]|uniref:Uncharacterized protein n=1 Tax=Rubroshorea leprosula TaxID=152421 RepID=A0AAV5IKN4_9ROSI|nr:hypothetical protein SLEP1_g13079 [Rubroshorea leprosula]
MGMDFTVWEEIERSGSYRVCSMYEEAASLASSVHGDDGKLEL